MRVAIVHDFLSQYGGAEKVLEALHEIWPEAPIYTLIYDKKVLNHRYDNWQIRCSPIQNLPLGVKKYRWYMALMPMAIERFNLSEFDLVISNVSAYAKGIITKQKTKHICYCHTPTRYLWSDTYDYIENLRGIEKIMAKLLLSLLSRLRIWDYVAAQRPDNFIANSHNIAARIKKYYRRDSTVVYPPVETEKFYISPELGDYFLVISRFRPYKRIDLAIEAFNKMKIPLKIIGASEGSDLLKRANSNIEFLGAVSDEEKAKYLSRCLALIHPQEEDFGITPVEAMAAGRPVIAYRAGGALETVIEGKTGEFFEEQTWQSLADAVIKFDPQKYNPQEIKKHAESFSKENFKKEFVKTINQFLNNG
ncbi:MAG: glycosyltransferase [Patescibacteria group bacterium]